MDSNFIAVSVELILRLSLLDGVLRVLLIIELITDLGKSFHEANLLMMLISDENLFGAQIRDARVTRVLIMIYDPRDIFCEVNIKASVSVLSKY